jgi:hypothetical protein
MDQPPSSIIPKSRYCGSWLRYENPHAAKAALRFSRLDRNRNSFDLMQRNLRFGPLVDQPASSITPKSRYCGSWLRYENPHAAKAALRFSRLDRNRNSFDLMQRNLRFGPLVDQPASSITPKSRYCGSWLRYENPHAAKAALRFSRLARNRNSFDLMQRNLRFGPLGQKTVRCLYGVPIDKFSLLSPFYLIVPFVF